MDEKGSKKILDQIEFPTDLRKISKEKLPKLSEEIRQFLIESVSKTGGHFGSNLGVVELTVALHRVFKTPKDILIWDVGHQAYTHKILTGRKSRLRTIRKKGGLAPFLKKEESEYDVFNTGHTSTSISVATGMALAGKNKKNAPRVVAVIGDGSLSGGMAFEALNHAGDIGADVLVVINDNKMSISPNVGGLEKYLTRVMSSSSYLNIRDKGREILSGAPKIKNFLIRAEKHAKGMIAPGMLFEELGFEYFGPIDGHDTLALVEVLENLKKMNGPRILHVITKKGKGYEKAENDEFSLHAVDPFDPMTGTSHPKKSDLSFTDVFSRWICQKAEKDERLQGITPAMCSGSGLLEFSRKFPTRFFDVGIAEQHALTFSAGLSSQGKKPVVAIYSSFLQRAYDQLIHDIALQKANVLLAIDRAGIVGPDGATHSGSFDLSYLRSIPNFIIMAPSSKNECYAMLEFGYENGEPVAVRYPRGGSVDKFSLEKVNPIVLAQARVEFFGKKLAILAFGVMLEKCRRAAEEMGATLVDMRFVKPLDEKLLGELSKSHTHFVTVEDNVVLGGAGSAVNEFFAREKIGTNIKNLGLPDRFLEHGSREEILAEAGLDENGILKEIQKFLR
jgi:1-deoxy-D-xylulose-5-phosphate synthase